MLRRIQKKSRLNFRLPFAARIVALVGVLIVGGIGVTQRVDAAMSMNEYCKRYTTTLELNACKDTLKGLDCTTIADAFQDEADLAAKATAVCKTTTTARNNGEVSLTGSGSGSSGSTPTTGSGSGTGSGSTPKPTATPNTDQSGNGGAGSPTDISAELQNILNQAKSLSQYLDILHNAGPDSDVDLSKQADNNYGSYVNGAGKQQTLKVLQQGSGSSPVILFINGGGWHANDQTGERVAAAQDGGENPWDRGYAMIDVTYRLGSSGVYYMYEDVMRGIAHVINNAPLYGIDPNRVVIWGDSAGGSLAIRAAASGKTGAKASVGWSAITNAYTAFFLSLPAFAIGIDHSTCAPTDIAGLANFTNLMAGGDGNVAEYGQGLNSNGFDALGITGMEGFSPLALLSQGVVAGQNLLSAAGDFETITNQIKSKNFTPLVTSTMNLASKKFTECIDNFNALSPALYTSPDAPPAFMVEFQNDTTVGPDQAWGYVDKLRQLGIRAEALVPPGDDECRGYAPDTLAIGCHLGYYPPFVRPTLDFLDTIIHPEQAGSPGTMNSTNNNSNTKSTDPNDPNSKSSDKNGSSSSSSGSSSSGGSSGSNSSGGGKSSSGNQGGSNNSSPAATLAEIAQRRCTVVGGTYIKNSDQKPGGTCVCQASWYQSACAFTDDGGIYYNAYYKKSGTTGKYTCPNGGTYTQNPSLGSGNICVVKK